MNGGVLGVQQGTASMPRKFRAQWSVGVGQAQEALSLPLDQRMDKFTYVYDRDGLHLNPHVVQKLRPELTEARERGVESRLVPASAGRMHEPGQDGTSPGRQPAAEAMEAKGRKAGKKTQSGSMVIQRGPCRAKHLLQQVSAHTHTHTHTHASRGSLIHRLAHTHTHL